MSNLVSELKTTLTELRFASRWAEIEMWWTVGKLLNNSNAKKSDVRKIAEYLDEYESDLWNAIYFYKRYPNLSDFVSGKNVSWSSICDNLE